MDVMIGSRSLAADIAVALDVAGREHLVVVAKATWRIPQAGQRPRPLPPQALVYSDEFFGSPEDSAMRYGADFARFKPACDVLFDSHAHSPDGQAVMNLDAAWSVGAMRKALRVLGERTWRKRMGGFSLSDGKPFLSVPLHYGRAFGGTRSYEKGRGESRQTLTEALLDNPIGLGWAGPRTIDQMDGAAAASLEPFDAKRAPSPRDKPPPVAFSAIARHWPSRKQYAGTYDEAWERDVFPLLPADFDERFHQCAPLDQQMPYPTGGETVVLRNMMGGRPYVKFTLPKLDAMAMRVLRTDYTAESLDPVVDTLFFEPDAERFSVVWRASTPLRRRLQEIDTITVGPVDPAWWEARSLGLSGGGCFGCESPAGDEGIAA